ncbi:MAG: hypothetical protein IKU76_06110 [Bacteroidaceae bacterium]|nr:hypothetical protein [Bacteroidaceae bacterium]
MTFDEFANKIRNIFQKWDMSVVDDTLKLSRPDTENIIFVFSKERFNQLYTETAVNASDKSLELCIDNCYYEVLLQSDSIRYGIDNEVKEYRDDVNKIKYVQGAVSEKFAFWLLYNGDVEVLSALIKRARIAFYVMMSDVSQDGENSLLDLISKCILRRYNSLIIESENKMNLNKAQSYMYAYVYTYMFNMQTSIYPCFDIESLFPQRRMSRRNGDFDHPKKIYNQELITYYNEAISSAVLSHKYLSFYHILEYFYEDIFMEDQISKAREIITDVGFSYKRKKDIVKLINNIHSKAIDKDVAINEKAALSLLIHKHIPQGLLKDRLIDRYGNEFLDKLKHKVEFSDGNVIIFSEADKKQYVESLTNRIYKTRNAIVHSKASFTEGKKNNKYQPIRDDEELFPEIALIQVMAEIIINDNAYEM